MLMYKITEQELLRLGQTMEEVPYKYSAVVMQFLLMIQRERGFEELEEAPPEE